MWAGHTNVKTTKRWYVKAGAADLLQQRRHGEVAGGV
jgi:hypothetical protein